MKQKNAETSHPTLCTPPVLVEGVDYYMDKGRWVFTGHFLLKRGECCGSGCRHCPYDHKNVRKK
jgi:hypothetical protein